jgi:hypothetical protein
MSLLHRDEPPNAGVNDALAVEGHWLGGQFRVNSVQYPYHSGAASLFNLGFNHRLRPAGPAKGNS